MNLWPNTSGEDLDDTGPRLEIVSAMRIAYRLSEKYVEPLFAEGDDEEDEEER